MNDWLEKWIEKEGERDLYNEIIFARGSVFKDLDRFQSRPSLVFYACTNNNAFICFGFSREFENFRTANMEIT